VFWWLPLLKNSKKEGSCNMKKMRFGLLILAILLVASTACLGAKKTEVLKVGMMPFGGNVPAKYAFDQKWFKKAGLDVVFYMFANGAGINEALAAKQIDMGVSGLAMVFSLASGTCTWVAESNTSSGMGIYVRPNSKILSVKGKIADKPEMYGSAETIKGMKVLGQLGTSSQFNVICYIKQFGLKESDITMVNVDLGTDLQAFIAGEGDALAASRPFSFKAEEKGFKCVATFEDATGVILHDGIVVRNDVLKKRRKEIVTFLKQYFRASEIFASDKQLRFDYSKKYFAENGRNYTDKDMWDEIRVQKYITKSEMLKPNYKYGAAMISIAQFYSDGGKITKENLPNVEKSFNVSLIKEALGVNVKVASPK
jgi:sulfonate transport system substrate-binding protein